MNIKDIKVGQLFGVHFPYASTPELRGQKFGFRVVRISEWDFGRGAYCENVKTGEVTPFAFPYNLDGGRVPKNWVLIEDAQ